MNKHYCIFLIAGLIGCTQPEFISGEEALEDMNVFQEDLEFAASYCNLADKSVAAKLAPLKTYFGAQEKVSVYELADSLSKLMGYFGDRHSYVRIEDDSRNTETLFLPFATAPLQDSLVIAVMPNKQSEYDLVYEEFPVLASINGVDVSELLQRADYRHQKAPKEAKWYRQAMTLVYIEANFHLAGIPFTSPLECVFKDLAGTKDTLIAVTPTSKRVLWNELGDKMEKDKKSLFGDQEGLFQRIDDVGIISIPEMVREGNDDSKGFYDLLQKKMLEYRDTKALIIDVRNNPGGRRHLIGFFSQYFSDPDYPWVANVAVARETPLDNDEYNDRMRALNRDQLNARFLYQWDSPYWNEQERSAIDQFITSFEPKLAFDSGDFSSPHVMVLPIREFLVDSYAYDKPVYILANERSFSAASVLVAAFKGHPNVKIAGVKVDGSSGMSYRTELPNSKLVYRYSRMVSFQRNGLTLDGNGVEPDILLMRDLDHVLARHDSQLDDLLKIINDQ
ncbi:MAG: hypothetical protein CMB80_18660 [Flammeovirgaceae bacterium]|nr:hypothetical protein [Flammeovirgaceae bacterium]MBE61846.1 hypothetical protein [Flammeovirgaceae bacterium]